MAMFETMMMAIRAMMAYSIGGSWFEPDLGASIRTGSNSWSIERVFPLMLTYFSPGMAVEMSASNPEDVYDAEDYGAGCEGAYECEEGDECEGADEYAECSYDGCGVGFFIENEEDRDEGADG